MKKLVINDVKALVYRKTLELYVFLKFVFKNIFDDGCSSIASTLTFTSLLAIVPLMSVSFALLSSFPVFQELSGPMQDYIFEHFVPATGKVVHQYVIGFTQQVSKLSIWGIAFLFVTAVMVMVTIENAFNKIWKVRYLRHGTSAFLLYWAILSLTPVLLGLSVAASSYVISLPMWDPHASFGVSFFIKHAPYLISIISFSFLYVVVPNCQVKIWHAFVGSVVAATLLEIAKKCFSWYLSSYGTYELLYGAFATVPLFFLWVYWAWFIILLGAEVAYAFSAPHHRRTGTKLDPLSHSIHWLGALWRAYQQGKGLRLEQLIRQDTFAYEVKPEVIIEYLLNAKLITLIDNGKYIISRDLDRLSFDELRALLAWRLPKKEILTQPGINPIYIQLIADSQEANKTLFAISMAKLLS